ncbi:ribokinase [Salinicoccus halodurans]|uniref:Ribokinase n=1 Tax=Salinicoccus halodurans TaxID=407035 RepID=A0A0F7HJH6_9STAP|nr:ribokinase [Salinicoccus halodurans]AKG73528.1 ribokinase [Salinicoccus halodurans]SFK52095.1 ribokinase [Salinicoccus halodurans]
MDIVVVGSLSTDFIVQAERMPYKGETILGTNFSTAYGGKGANQAVAAARLETKTAFVGAIGDDGFGEKLKMNLENNAVFCENMETFTDEATGTAHINIYDNDNSIIVVPGTNSLLTPEVVEKSHGLLKRAEYVMLQNEIPVETIKYVIDFCYENGVKVIYNPAPFIPIEIEYLEKCALITPNELECNALFGDDVKSAIRKHPNQLIVTMGDAGCLYHNGEEEVRVPSFRTTPVDTTGAGDTFNGALAAFLVKGMSLGEAIRSANMAASLSIRAMGAQGGIPTLNEWQEAMDNV